MSVQDEVPFVTRSFVDYSGDFSPRAVSITWRTQPFLKQRWPVIFLLQFWPGLLEAWLVLTSVKYHGNLYILIPLNQRLALTRLRATGPCTLHDASNLYDQACAGSLFCEQLPPAASQIRRVLDLKLPLYRDWVCHKWKSSGLLEFDLQLGCKLQG